MCEKMKGNKKEIQGAVLLSILNHRSLLTKEARGERGDEVKEANKEMQ